MTDQQKTYKPVRSRRRSPDETKLEDVEILRRACANGKLLDKEAFNSILMKYRDRLLQIISLRIGLKLQGRIDASDVIQDTYVEASRTLDKYLQNPDMPVFLWLRHLAGEKLIQANRFHIDAKKRSTGREVSLNREMPQACSRSLASQLVGSGTSPSGVAIRNENKRRLEAALVQMDAIDREVLVLRHFEHLTSRESAIVLNMEYEAVKKRYTRALSKLERILSRLNDSSEIDPELLAYYQDRR